AELLLIPLHETRNCRLPSDEAEHPGSSVGEAGFALLHPLRRRSISEVAGGICDFALHAHHPIERIGMCSPFDSFELLLRAVCKGALSNWWQRVIPSFITDRFDVCDGCRGPHAKRFLHLS